MIPQNVEVTVENAGSDDKDRCKYTWENYYQSIYAGEPYWKSKFENLIAVNKGYGVKDNDVCISGDTLFNFKDDKNHTKYQYYRKKLKETFDGEELLCYMNMLDFCSKMTHTFYNFGMLPVIADLQAVKNNQRDRLDRFVWLLNGWYLLKNDEDKRNRVLFSHISDNPRGPKKRVKAKWPEKREARK